MMLSKNFSFVECYKSDTANKHGIDNKPVDPIIIDNLKYLCTNLLQVIRDLWGKPIVTNSVYRNPAVNKLVGGSATSDHMNGLSADIRCGSYPERDIFFDFLMKNIDKLDFDQIIKYDDKTIVHVSTRKSGNRREVLSYTKSNNKYNKIL